LAKPAWAIPEMSYWECMWNALLRSGWSLQHSSYTDQRTGAVRHLVHATAGGREIVCSAPTVADVIRTLYAQSRHSHLGKDDGMPGSSAPG
jgi:hypothetical protein